MTKRSLMTTLAIAGVAMVACRPVPDGDPVYPVYERFRPPGFLPGFFPFEEGQERLFLGVFYENDFTEELDFAADGADTDFFDFVVDPEANPLVFTAMSGTSSDRIEGLTSGSVTVLEPTVAFWGVGLVNEGNPYDLDAGWTHLHVALKATDPGFETTNVGIESTTGSNQVLAADPAYGDFAADGEWHSVKIPLADFVDVDFANITVPFSLASASGTDDAVLLFDDLYWTKE